MGYSSAFFESQQRGSVSSAATLMPTLVDWLNPVSLIDIGCGTGGWAAAALDAGVRDVVGVDGPYMDPARLLISPEKFVEADLAKPFRMDRRFDVAMCLEVAEHLPCDRGPELVRDLCMLADVVIFSAAIPGQGGTHHVNLRWQSYWAELFAQRGMKVGDFLRPLIWRDGRIEWWYRQNMFVAASRPLPSLQPAEPLLDVVHPDLWQATQSEIGIRTLLERVPGAVRASLRYRFRAKGGS